MTVSGKALQQESHVLYGHRQSRSRATRPAAGGHRASPFQEAGLAASRDKQMSAALVPTESPMSIGRSLGRRGPRTSSEVKDLGQALSSSPPPRTEALVISPVRAEAP